MRGGLEATFDLIVTDPPYGDGIGYGRNGKTILNNEDESINYKILPLLYKVLKPDKSCYLFTNWKFEHKLRNFIETETDFNIRMLICIVKNKDINYGEMFDNLPSNVRYINVKDDLGIGYCKN